MIDAIPIPETGSPVRKLGSVVRAIAKAINALINLTFQPGDDWDLQWEEGGAVFVYPDDDGGGGDLVFLGSKNGQLNYWSLTGTDLGSTPPAGSTITNPP